MNKEQLLQLLPLIQSPDDGTHLSPSATGDQLVSAGGKFHYPLQQGIPKLLPASRQEAPHKESAFDYVDHYVKDADYYDYFKEYEDGPTRHENRRLHEAILAEIPNDIQSILDVGCGSGWIAKAMQQRAVQLVSMDISLKNVHTTLQKYPFKGHQGLVADLFALPFRDQTFDCIVCAEVIEHVVDPGLLIQELVRRLSPNGVLILTTPHDEKIVYHMCVHCNRPTPENAHLHSFTKKKLLDLAVQHASEVGSASSYTFSNKYLTRLRTHLLLQYLPFGLWKKVDALANTLAAKPVRLLLKVTRSDGPLS
ncbi:MAG: class I SAM-dependent methyltransferase [Bacteroidota bacterium]